MANSVTVPGVSGTVTLSSGTGDTLNIAQMIGAALSSLGGSLIVTEVSSGPITSPGTIAPGTTNELVFSANDSLDSISSGYDVAVVTAAGTHCLVPVR